MLLLHLPLPPLVPLHPPLPPLHLLLVLLLLPPPLLPVCFLTSLLPQVDEIARLPNTIPISCYHKMNLDGLLARIWDMMVSAHPLPPSPRPVFPSSVRVGQGLDGCYNNLWGFGT